ncbi:Nha1p RNJ42_00693 [Nakaseomyces bracarensis]|uniref:Nha1p n=1 Tax=Nakaseomyces bracarensis TaxID=273131 RepID=UPI0038723A9C
MVWGQLEVTKAHVAYACVGVFSSIFSLVSLFVKEKLYIGESTVAGIFGLIVGPVCLDWFNPLKWGNSDTITLEITRIVLCLQIFAVAVELPRKYMKKHWLSVTMLLIPVMTTGWLIIGLFVWIIIPRINFPSALLVSACITATDPILAQSVVSGKFAKKVPGHLRNLLSAESGCNDGMAFPFIYLSLLLVLHPGRAGLIIKDWICITLLYECLFGCILGVIIGYCGRQAIKFAEEKNIIDRESFLAFYVVLTFICTGFGSILGVDDLLVSFSAGAAFAWDGWFAQKTEESNVSTVIDVLLNYAYFIYFGAIVPWAQFNNGAIGLNVWRLIVLAIIVIFLRRIPAVLILKPVIPDIKSWREALFVGHFGPIGVGAIFAAILARGELEHEFMEEPTPLNVVPPETDTEHWQLISIIWPMTCFFIVTSIIIHGSSVAVITLGRHLNTVTLTKTFTTHTTNGNGKSSWMQRLPSLDKTGRSFSLHRVDTQATSETQKLEDESEDYPEDIGTEDENGFTTSGIPARAVGGMRSRRKKLKKKGKKRAKQLMRRTEKLNPMYKGYDDELNDLGRERLQLEREAAAGTFALGRNNIPDENSELVSAGHGAGGTSISGSDQYDEEKVNSKNSDDSSSRIEKERKYNEIRKQEETPHIAYAEGNRLIFENRHGEIIDEAKLSSPSDEEAQSSLAEPLKKTKSNQSSAPSLRSMSSLKKIITPPSIKKVHSIMDHSRSKYTAYKIDDMLIIEDKDGEVIRRYKINTHDKANAKNDHQTHTRSERSSSVVSRALSVVGFRNGSKTSLVSEEVTDEREGEKPLTLTPIPSRMYDQTSDRITEEGYGEGNSYYNESEGFDDNDLSYESENREEEDEESGDDNTYIDNFTETPFERDRRLNALGHISVPADEDDEEEPIMYSPPHQTRSKVKDTLSKSLGLKTSSSRNEHKH